LMDQILKVETGNDQPNISNISSLFGKQIAHMVLRNVNRELYG